MRGKVVVVTGANGGIGKVTATELAKRGATVVCVCRDATRGEAARADILRDSGAPATQVELMLCDLSSQASIRAFAKTFRETHPALHVLVNNAGVVNPERKVTVDGYEATFALNHLGYFLLTHELLGLLRKSAPARILNLSSHAQRMIKRIDFDDLMGERSYKSLRAYSQSKLANVMFTYDLAERLAAGEGAGALVTVNAIHPGPVATGFGSEYRGAMGLLMKLGRGFMRTPEKGAETVVWAASAPELDKVTSKYFFDHKAVPSVASSYDAASRRRLWDLSEKLVGIPAGTYGA